jgi:hypothetical protein
MLQAADFGVAAAGQAESVIAVGKDSTAPEKNAATLLAKYLGKVTGTEFTVVDEDAVKAGTRAIYVGQTKFAAGQGIDFSKLDREEWVIRSVGADALVISGGRPRGVLYGVLEFLEWQVGVHWFDPMTECVPSRPTLAVPPLNIRAKPAFAARFINPYLGYSKDNPKAGLAPQSRAFWFAINKNCGLNGSEYITGETRKQFGGGEPFGSPSSVHNHFVYMPPDKYFEAHPEYYSLIKGKRVRTTQICFSHPEVRAIFKKRLREFIEQDRVKFKAASEAPPRFYVIMQQDAHPKIFCECEGCMKIFEREGANSGLLVDFVNDLARDIRDDYPDVTLVVFPYTSTIEPPRSLCPEDNVAVYIGEYSGDSWRPLTHPHNEENLELIRRWSAMSKITGTWDYSGTWQMGLRIPAPDIKPVAADIKTWYDLNGKIYYLSMSTPERRSFYWLDVWVALKLLDNPNQDPEWLIDTYLQGYYGPAAPHLRKFIDYASETIARSEEKIARNELYSLGRWRQCYDLPFLNPEYYTRLGEFLDGAEKACHGQDGYARAVRRERLMVDRAMLMHWDWLAAKNKDLPFNREKIVQRFSANGADWFNWYWESGFLLSQGMSFDWPRRNLIETEASAFAEYGRKRELPAAFGGIASGDMIDFAWPEFAFDRPADIQPDAAAFGGRAYHSKVNAYSALWGDQHQGLPSIRVGLNRRYSFPSVSNTWQEISIPRKDLPEDGKYHWYHVGTVPGYDHDTFLRIIGQVGKTAAVSFSSLCRPGLENVPLEVYLSMRTENMNPGKAEKGKPELVAVDRVVFVKSSVADKVELKPASAPRAETKKQE